MASETWGSLFTWFAQLYQRELEELYERCFKAHGDLGVSRESLTVRLYEVVESSFLQNELRDVTDPIVLTFLKNIYVNDLYLAAGTLKGNSRALEVFEATYDPFLLELALFYRPEQCKAERLTKLVFGSVLKPPKTRNEISISIASYDGRSSLKAWLLALLACSTAKHLHRLPSLSKLLATDSKGTVLPFNKDKDPEESSSPEVTALPSRDRLLTLLMLTLNLQPRDIAVFFHTKTRTLNDQAGTVMETIQEHFPEESNAAAKRIWSRAARREAKARLAAVAVNALCPTSRHERAVTCLDPNLLASYFEGRLSFEEEETADTKAMTCVECLRKLMEMIVLSDYAVSRKILDKPSRSAVRKPQMAKNGTPNGA
ncbi:hypothetical protein ACFLU6_15185 [Acidobacteriota bacterium]